VVGVTQVVATATIFFKRFYYKHTWTSIQPYLMALTCIYLAAKVEECGPIQARRVQGIGDRVVRI
jgi:cyclin C